MKKELRERYKPKNYEVTTNKKQQYVRIFETMLMHPKILQLSGNAKALYLYMKLWAQKSREFYQTGEFTYSIALAEKVLNVSKPTAVKTIEELVNSGVIERTNNAKYTKTIAKFRFNDKWYSDSEIAPNKQKVKSTKTIDDGTGYLYVVKLDSAYKIGISKNPKQRLKEFTLLPYKLEPIVCEKVYDYAQLEAELHLFFSDKHMRGEWYKLEESDITKIKNIVAMRKV